jgi:hypothetical protein
VGAAANSRASIILTRSIPITTLAAAAMRGGKAVSRLLHPVVDLIHLALGLLYDDLLQLKISSITSTT